MFSLSYVWAEIRRRKGRTILTALGLGVGVARLRDGRVLEVAEAAAS
jgi:hypothetical protein